MSEERFDLAGVINELRDQLRAASLEGANEKLKFIVNEADIELQVGVTACAEAKGGVKFWVYEAGASGKLEKETVQTIRLKLGAVDEHGKPLKISQSVEF